MAPLSVAPGTWRDGHDIFVNRVLGDQLAVALLPVSVCAFCRAYSQLFSHALLFGRRTPKCIQSVMDLIHSTRQTLISR